METLSQRLDLTRHQVGDAWMTFFEATRDAALDFGKTAEAATTALTHRAKSASQRFTKSAKQASRAWVDETSAATTALAEQSLNAGKELVEGLRQESLAWGQVAGSRAIVLRLQAPAGLREMSQQGLVRRLELERVALERIREILHVLDERVSERLGWLEQLPDNQLEMALPPGYDELSARRITSESAKWTPTELRAAISHESQTKERSTVLGTLERRLEGYAQAS